MATISTTISLVDRMSSGLATIGGAADKTLARLDRMDSGAQALQKTVDSFTPGRLAEPQVAEAWIDIGVRYQPEPLPELAGFEDVSVKVGYEVTPPELKPIEDVSIHVGYEVTPPELKPIEDMSVRVGYEVTPPELAGFEDVSIQVGYEVTPPELEAFEDVSIKVGYEVTPVPIEALARALNLEGMRRQVEAGEAIGAALPAGIARGIAGGTGTVIDAVTGQAEGALSAGRGMLNDGAGRAMGLQLAAGVAAGVQSGTGAVVSAMERMMTRALAAARSAADIHSPSKETAWMGEMLGRGLAEGVNGGADRAIRAAGDVMRLTLGAMDEGLWQQVDAMRAMEEEDRRRAGERGYARRVSESDAKKMRALAEREVVNQFHTAEVKVDFTANNTISSELDLDKIVEALEDRVTERLEAVAEGVYD